MRAVGDGSRYRDIHGVVLAYACGIDAARKADDGPGQQSG
jgi:hypothetical protein